MNHSDSSKQIISMWLIVATKGLTAPAKERIRLEIEAHFFDAVESHLAGGCNEMNAQAAALRELGNANTAAKRFRQKHLTVKETQYVGQFLQPHNARMWFITAFLLTQVSGPLIFSYSRAAIVLSFLGTVIITTYEVVRRKYKSKIRLLVSLQLLSDANFLLCALGLATWLTHWTWDDCAYILVVSLASLVSIFRDSRILIKLRKLSDLPQEMPPTDAASS